MMKLVFIGLVALFMSACDCQVSTPYGAVPSQFLPAAVALTGVFKGTFNQVPMTLTLGLDGNRPYMLVANDQNNDLLGPGCLSSVDEMQDFRVDTSKAGTPRVTSAQFGLDDAGRCLTDDTAITLSFDDRDHFEVVVTGTSEEDCSASFCMIVNDPVTLTGEFARVPAAQ